jgi:hypothetical protein
MSIIKVNQVQDTSTNVAANISGGVVTFNNQPSFPGGSLAVNKGGTGATISCPAFQLKKTSDQSTSSGVTVTVSWEAANIDTQNLADLGNNRVTITTATAGLWYVGVNLAQKTLNFRARVGILKNGSTFAIAENATHTVANNGSRLPSIFTSNIVSLANGDHLTWNYIPINGANNLEGAFPETYCFGWRISI